MSKFWEELERVARNAVCPQCGLTMSNAIGPNSHHPIYCQGVRHALEVRKVEALERLASALENGRFS